MCKGVRRKVSLVILVPSYVLPVVCHPRAIPRRVRGGGGGVFIVNIAFSMVFSAQQHDTGQSLEK